MKIAGTQTEYKNVIVDVSMDDAVSGIITHFLTKAKIGVLYPDESLSIENGKIWKEYEEGGGNHSWFDKKVIVENPSVQQVNVLKYVHILEDAFKQLKRNTE